VNDAGDRRAGRWRNNNISDEGEEGKIPNQCHLMRNGTEGVDDDGFIVSEEDKYGTISEPGTDLVRLSHGVPGPDTMDSGRCEAEASRLNAVKYTNIHE
jgi:hypothetical protein